MRSHITLFLGVFSIMALSNAIVPVLPAFSSQSSWSGAIYAAYFLGAFLSTLPAGILSDWYGRIFLVRIGLVLTLASGIILVLIDGTAIAIAARFIEGIGAGLFIAPSMASVNRETEHAKISGYFMALLNTGLVLGLIIAGILATQYGIPKAGIIFFTMLAGIPAITSAFTREPRAPPSGHDLPAFLSLVREYRWLWYSSAVLVGITGVITSLYPKYSGAPADIISLWVAGMSVATIGGVLVISRIPLNDIVAIRISAILLMIGVMITFISPLGFIVVGFLAGIVMIALMSHLSRNREHQGIAMGLFSTTSYLGMAVLPSLAGLVADAAGFFIAFAVTALSAVTVALGLRHN